MSKSMPLQTTEEVSALARGLSLVRAVADAANPMSHADLVVATGLPKATVSRLAATLLAADYLRQSPDNERYRLGPALLDLGNAFLRHFDFRKLARLHLADLADTTGTNVHLGIREGLDVLLIDTFKPSATLILSRMDVGSRMALATSAAGRAYLASLPDADHDRLRAELLAASSDREALGRRLSRARQEYRDKGYCSSFGEWHADIHALGFTLRSPQNELYAVSCGGPAFKLSARMLREKVAPRLLEARRAIFKEAGLPVPGSKGGRADAVVQRSSTSDLRQPS